MACLTDLEKNPGEETIKPAIAAETSIPG